MLVAAAPACVTSPRPPLSSPVPVAPRPLVFSSCVVVQYSYQGIPPMSVNDWHQIEALPGMSWTCGYCNLAVGGDRGYQYQRMDVRRRIYVCPSCEKPTFFGDEQVPGVAFGNDVGNLPADVAAMYREARNCVTTNSFTASVLACRKLMMHIAVERGAAAGLGFVQYVDFLDANGYVPPQGRAWVDHVRLKSNEANHQIVLMDRGDAVQLLSFVEMLLLFVYDFPARMARGVRP